MRANKLETALSRDRLACLTPPDIIDRENLLISKGKKFVYIAYIYMCIYLHTSQGKFYIQTATDRKSAANNPLNI